MTDLFNLFLSETAMKIGFAVSLTLAAWWVLFLVFLNWKAIISASKRFAAKATEPKAANSIDSARLKSYFSHVGRVTRRQYLITQIIAGVCLGVMFLVAAPMLNSWNAFLQGLGWVAITLSLALTCWVVVAASAKRMRDTGVTVWWVLTLLVPPLNLAAMAFLLLVPSDEFEGKGL